MTSSSSSLLRVVVDDFDVPHLLVLFPYLLDLLAPPLRASARAHQETIPFRGQTECLLKRAASLPLHSPEPVGPSYRYQATYLPPEWNGLHYQKYISEATSLSSSLLSSDASRQVANHVAVCYSTDVFYQATKYCKRFFSKGKRHVCTLSYRS